MNHVKISITVSIDRFSWMFYEIVYVVTNKIKWNSILNVVTGNEYQEVIQVKCIISFGTNMTWKVFCPDFDIDHKMKVIFHLTIVRTIKERGSNRPLTFKMKKMGKIEIAISFYHIIILNLEKICKKIVKIDCTCTYLE